MASKEENDILFDDSLIVKLQKKLGDTSNVWQYFGKILRDGVEIDASHNYCDVCLKSKIIKR